MELFVIRHGETLWNKLNILQGNLDSKLLDSSITLILNLKYQFELKNLTFDVVCSSSSKRAIETARFLGYDNIVTMPEFCELGMGDMQGKTYDEFNLFHQEEYNNYFKSPKSYNPRNFKGEPYDVLVKRIECGMDTLKKKFNGKKVLLITHGVTIQGIISYLDRGYVDLDDFSRIPLPKNLELRRYII